jgi:hypothetical protein
MIHSSTIRYYSLEGLGDSSDHGGDSVLPGRLFGLSVQGSSQLLFKNLLKNNTEFLLENENI